MKTKLFCVSILSVHMLFAEDLGSIAKTYPIGEQSLIEYIKARSTQMINDGSWEKLRQQAVKQTEQRIDYPPVIAGISKTSESSIRYFDPSVRINQDIVDPYTKTKLASKGQLINPTNYMPFNNELIFIDGRDPDQVNYALQESKRSKFRTSIVLIAANKFRELMKDHNHLMFYDQGATLVKKFEIRHVPTIIYQDQIHPNKLRIQEVKL